MASKFAFSRHAKLLGHYPGLAFGFSGLDPPAIVVQAAVHDMAATNAKSLTALEAKED